MLFLLCVCYAFVRVCLLLPCGHLLGKGWPLGSRLWCLIVSLLLSHWYPGSGVALDCIDSWSLSTFVLSCYCCRNHPQGFKDYGKGLNQNRAEHISHNVKIKSTVNKQVKHVNFVMACMGYGIAKHFKNLKNVIAGKRSQLTVSILGHDLMAGSCKRSRVCEIQGCTTTHHRLIHIKAESPNQKQTQLGLKFIK